MTNSSTIYAIFVANYSASKQFFSKDSEIMSSNIILSEFADYYLSLVKGIWIVLFRRASSRYDFEGQGIFLTSFIKNLIKASILDLICSGVT